MAHDMEGRVSQVFLRMFSFRHEDGVPNASRSNSEGEFSRAVR